MLRAEALQGVEVEQVDPARCDDAQKIGLDPGQSEQGLAEGVSLGLPLFLLMRERELRRTRSEIDT